MQLSEMRALLLALLDEDGVRRGNAVLNASLGEGYVVMALMTQGSEVTHTYPNVSGSIYWWALPADFFVPIAVTWSGTRLYPIRMPDLDELSPTWMSDAVGTPTYYWCTGQLSSSAQLWLHPRPSAAGTLKLTYAQCPPLLGGDTDTPRLPEEYHYGVVLYAYMWELLKERGALLANKALRTLEEFTRHVNECQAYVYRRTPDRDYAMKPWDAEAVRRKLKSFQVQLQQRQGTDQTTMQEMAQ